MHAWMNEERMKELYGHVAHSLSAHDDPSAAANRMGPTGSQEKLRFKSGHELEMDSVTSCVRKLRKNLEMGRHPPPVVTFGKARQSKGSGGRCPNASRRAPTKAKISCS